MAEPTDAWRRLETDLAGPAGMRRTRIHGDSTLDLYAVIEAPSGRIGVSLEVASASASSTRAYASAGAFRTQADKLDGDRTRISIVLQQPEFRSVFGEMCADVIRWCLLAGLNERRAVDSLRDRLERWKDMFRSREPAPLNEREQLGLLGELLFLERVLRAGKREAAAIGTWHGPLGSAHDFHLGSTHVEVKSSIRGRLQVVHIASLDQLSVSPADELLLCHYVLETAADLQGVTLAAQVRLVRDLLGGDTLCAIFDDLLLRVGYLDVHATEHYDVVSFTHVAPACAVVEESFPALTRANVPSAVVEVRYELDLSLIALVSSSASAILEERIRAFAASA